MKPNKNNNIKFTVRMNNVCSWLTSTCDHLDVPQYMAQPCWITYVIARTTSENIQKRELLFQCLVRFEEFLFLFWFPFLFFFVIFYELELV